MSRREPHGGPPEQPPVVAHVCVTPRWVSRTILTLALVLLGALAAIVIGAIYVYQANQYVQGRGEYRDRETARTNERLNDAICDLLDQLPAGGLLERPRAKYHCGPGLPRSTP